MKNFLRQLRPALVALAVLTVVCGVVYPMIVTAVAQVAFNDNAQGSLITKDGSVVGSTLIGQQFVSPQYFHPRPSAAGNGYDSGASSGSNLGPHNPALLDTVAERVASYRTENGLSDDVLIPVDAVTASGSGLDPQISVANAKLQARRVAETRGLDVDLVLQLIADHTDDRDLWILGDPGVNVLELNLALDRKDPSHAAS